jgi:hypothetical protein
MLKDDTVREAKTNADFFSLHTSARFGTTCTFRYAYIHMLNVTYWNIGVKSGLRTIQRVMKLSEMPVGKCFFGVSFDHDMIPHRENSVSSFVLQLIHMDEAFTF